MFKMPEPKYFWGEVVHFPSFT